MSTSVEVNLSANDVNRIEGFYVVTLQGVSGGSQANDNRLHIFQESLFQMCGERSPYFQARAGQLSARRGAGLTATFIDILREAKYKQQQVAYIFEDDARLLNTFFCEKHFRKTLWKEMPNDSFALLFAAHHLVSHFSIETEHFIFVDIQRSHGSYAWGIRQENFDTLISLWDGLLAGNNDTLSPDIDLSRAHKNLTSYLLQVPQLAWHPPSFSNTWNVTRDNPGDTEKISMVIIHRSLQETNSFVNHYLEWNDILSEIIIVRQSNSSDEMHVADSEIRGTPIRTITFTKYSTSLRWRAVSKAGSNTVATLSSNTLITKEQLAELHSKFLGRPFSPLYFENATCKQVSSYQKVFDEGGGAILQRRLAKAYCNASDVLSLENFEDGCGEDVMRIMPAFFAHSQREQAVLMETLRFSSLCKDAIQSFYHIGVSD